jgi:hypothetical protein
LHASYWIKKVNSEAKFELLDLKTTLRNEVTPEWIKTLTPGSKQMVAVEKKLSAAAKL